MNTQNTYLALLHNIWLTHKKLHDIFKIDTDYKNFYESLNQEVLSKYKLTEKQIAFILEENKKINLEYIEKKIEKYSATIIDYHSDEYPKMLRNIANPPFLLYVQWALDNSPKFSVVWSRKITNYGKKCIEYIVPNIWKYFTIVSGWALGCDTEAHIACLHNNIKTIAVVGTGFDNCYPESNDKMYSKIVEKWGALISIFPFHEPANRYNFPVRNEIVAWLWVWALIVEAQERSGSLITAWLCLDLWKDLFACPGEIFKSTSSWCNKLILNGEAKITTHANDILSEYNISISAEKTEQKTKPIFKDKIDEKIYDLLLFESLTIDEMIGKSWLNIRELTLKLSMLEIWGHISKSHWAKYELN